MGADRPEREEVVAAIRRCAEEVGGTPSRAEFKRRTGISEYHVLQHFEGWNDAVRAAGLDPDTSNVKLSDDDLLEDWGQAVRDLRAVPTRHQYRRKGEYSPGVFEKHFGPWSTVPDSFRRFAETRPEWGDVLALLPVEVTRAPESPEQADGEAGPPHGAAGVGPRSTYAALEGRPTYGNPLDFRGLRHEPVNESGVVFLFGMVAHELGYMVEAMQAGYPDCEAKRQVAPGRWQRVRIEFEFESRNFRDHGHQPNGCDVIVCWRHNWPECPSTIEVVELQKVIRSLGRSED
jgi:hypothetical protein